MASIHARRPPHWKWLLVAGAGLMAATVLGATLRSRPDMGSKSARFGFVGDESFDQTLRRLNSANYKQIEQAGLESTYSADSLTVCRRLSLAMVGSGLSLEEIRALEQIEPKARITWWTEHLLSDPRWADYFGQRLARACVGTNEGPFLLFRRRKFNLWLSEELAKGTPYDAIVRQMVASEGLWTDTPSVNFVTATMVEGQEGRADPIRLAGRTSRAFLAMRIDCLQCHDDVLQKTNFGSDEFPREGTQHDFHQLAAFFSGTATDEVVFRGITEDERPYEVQFLGNSQPETVKADVPFLKDRLPALGKPRQRLAQWVTSPENKPFARATVNRIWALMFGKALVEPVDDIPLVGDIPPMLDILADDFVKHGFNLRRLVALIAATDAFRRDSRANFDVSEKHEDTWAVFPLVQLRPDQVAGSVTQACRLNAIDRDSSILVQLKVFGDSQEFVKRFGDRGEDEFDSDPITIPQRLLMMNGNMTTEYTGLDLANASKRIADFVGENDQAIDLIFLTVLNRRPTLAEHKCFIDHLADKYGNTRARALTDITWAMLNSTEFSWNH